jgi:hypothetical protein
VYLPPSFTRHATDWQQQLPQLDWQVISAAYQEAHPGLSDQWGTLFLQLGAVSVPSLVPRVVNRVELLQQQQQLLQQIGSGDSTSMPGTLGLTDAAAAPAAAAAAGNADDRRQQQQSAPTSNADAAAVAGVTMSDAAAMDADIDTNKQQLTTPPAAAAAEVAAAAVHTARRVRFEAADVPSDETNTSSSSSNGTLIDWWCPDLEALLRSMPAMQHTSSSSSSSSSEVLKADVMLQHAALCRCANEIVIAD